MQTEQYDVERRRIAAKLSQIQFLRDPPNANKMQGAFLWMGGGGNLH